MVYWTGFHAMPFLSDFLGIQLNQTFDPNEVQSLCIGPRVLKNKKKKLIVSMGSI